MEPFRIGLPARLNAKTIHDLLSQLESARASEARVWVLEGDSEGAFCRGMDLSSVATAQQARVGVGAFVRCMSELASAPRPTVAVVNGEVLGGGVGLMSICDLVVASEPSTVALPEALFGILPAMIMPALLSRMSPQKARLLSLTCTAASSDWAKDAGLFDRVVPADKLDRARRRAIRDLSRVHGAAVPRVRDLIRMASASPFDAALERGAALAEETVADAAIQKRVARFLDEGIAPWTP